MNMNYHAISNANAARDNKDQKLTELRELVHDWVSWLYTRRFYAPYVPQNILVRMIEEHTFKTGEPPNARNSPLCSVFNKVLKLAAAEEPEHLIPFMYVYFPEYRPMKIQALAITMGINSDTVYERAHKAGQKYLRRAKYHLAISSDVDCLEAA
jgi:hypothetical protein